MTDFEDFIVRNTDADIPRLLLSCKEWPEDKGLAISTIEARKKLRKKVPEWYSCTSLIYPSALCAEQCSSSATASYKAALAARILEGAAEKRIADLTGGLGVDSWAFSKVADKVLYNDMSLALASAARHNFSELGAGNIRVCNQEAAPESLPDILDGFAPGIVFMDPARRNKDGKKVFLLEDCSPDVLKLIPGIFASCRHLLLKLSPMADIPMVAERLDRALESYMEKATGNGWNGQWVREIHVVAWGGECKELLVWMDREWDGEYSLTCCEDGVTLAFRAEETTTKPALPQSAYAKILFEPGKSLTKAGVSNTLCERFGLVKLGRFTQLFTFEGPVDTDVTDELRKFGKLFDVKEFVPMKKATLKDIGRLYPHSEVSAKNIPLTSDELRSRLGVSSGDDAHIFGARVETPFESGNYLIVCTHCP